ncbi:MAG: 4-(cytidine 5'-diphospho)-2-C-methyl-D-erythritol kinase [Bacteroidales bacterium]|nr:4-(cytidine 5'-diphospho)-2-C-methyl-D-erythritol kinase [Bacteroidales bacterium]
MIDFPNAKINIGLHVVEKRTDGFHNIETVFYPIPLCDVLEIIVDEQLTFTNLGIEINAPAHENLCFKAYQLLAQDFNLPPAKIVLQKLIPFGAGLGGGSSDAAFTIKILNQLFLLGISDAEMESYARKLGSDCAFFIKNEPVYAYNKGDEFAKIDLSLKNKKLLLIKPSISIPTSVAYAEIKPQKGKIDLNELSTLPLVAWKDIIVNDFEFSVFKKYPELNEIKKMLYNYGALYASMSGSGSCMYGIFENDFYIDESTLPYQFSKLIELK